MILFMSLIAYALAMTLANLSAAKFGPAVTPINAFVLIGLDLALRDWLHIRLRHWQMFFLISATGGLTYFFSQSAGSIAIASAISFTVAAIADWAVFSRMSGSWIKRANGSNIAGAGVDSIVFPTIAFGGLMWQIVAMQFLAKVVGGLVWSKAIEAKLKEKNNATSPSTTGAT